ncbi:MAG TPA: AI-2E family transporter [Pyrinomonadaceae bacterium]|jgi:predicted PurR-regulated permease PerM|nr:AI-2E family transporter [Pyrinomonadaceae bacterium]
MAEQKIEKRDVKEVAETAAESAAAASASVTTTATWAQTRAILRLLTVVFVVLAFVWTLYKLQSVLLLLVLSIFFAYLIAPLVELVRRPFKLGRRERLMPRPLAIAVVYVAIFGSIGLAIFLLLPQMGEQIAGLGKQVPVYSKSISERAQSLERFYQRIPSGARETVKQAVSNGFNSISEYLQASVAGAVPVVLAHLPWLVLVPILAFFLLKDADSFRRSALQMLPRGRLRWRGDELFQDVNSTLAAYIRAQLIACLIIGVICTVGFVLLGVPYALVMGLVAGFFEFIPLAGPLAVAIIAITLASFHSPGTAVGVFIFLAVLRIAQDYVIYPRIIGSGIHLHPLAVILAILAGAELAGVAGIFLAIPVIAVIAVTYRHWMEHRGRDEGLVATLLKPADQTAAATDAALPPPHPANATPEAN